MLVVQGQRERHCAVRGGRQGGALGTAKPLRDRAWQAACEF